MGKRLVIIPTYNEIENIEEIIREVFSQAISFDILVVDDNSPDKTADKVCALQSEFPEELFLEVRKKKSGLGTAYIHGFKWALQRSYEYIFEMDADFSHNPKDLERLYNACLKGADLAIGSRYSSGINVINWPMDRVLLSWVASKYVKFITGLKVHDATAGFVCYKRAVLEKINLEKIQFVGYAFQIEMKFKANLLGFVIEEVPIIFTNRVKGTSKMSSGIFSEAFFGVIKMKVKSLFTKDI
ncbi:MAG TPA: polyprenol monophosphomannose synthase [Flavobacteriaceae bacterium]|nr:polyprenol monophosphomannose synthase [Flavobacteriaceae bacterium]